MTPFGRQSLFRFKHCSLWVRATGYGPERKSRLQFAALYHHIWAIVLSCLFFSFASLSSKQTEYFFTPHGFWNFLLISNILISIRTPSLRFAEEHSTSDNNQIFLSFPLSSGTEIFWSRNSHICLVDKPFLLAGNLYANSGTRKFQFPET